MFILESLGLNPVKPYTNNKAVPLSAADPALLYGLELEIEGIPTDPTEYYVPGMGGEADNSLRDNEYGRGWEFITKPATFSVAALILSNFFGKLKPTQEKNYSERCSVHVHANVQDLTADQLKSVCLLYQVFERLFYSFAGDDRDKNIFCVPWAETTMTHQLIDKMVDGNLRTLRNWQKYTGLNLIPVTTQGTIEFRHLPGTCDLPRILDWLNLIGCLFATARAHSFEVIKDFIILVNTTSEYKHLLQRVFNEWERALAMPFMEEQLEEGILDVKYILLSSSPQKQAQNPLRAYLDEAVRAGVGFDAPMNPWRREAPVEAREEARVIPPMNINDVLEGMRAAEDWRQNHPQGIRDIPFPAAPRAVEQAARPVPRPIRPRR